MSVKKGKAPGSKSFLTRLWEWVKGDYRDPTAVEVYALIRMSERRCKTLDREIQAAIEESERIKSMVY